MDVGERDKVETHKSNEDMVNHHTSRAPSDWPSSGANFANLLMGMTPDGNPITVRKGEYVSPSSLVSMVDSFGPAPALWDHLANSQSMGFAGINDHSSISAFDKLGLTRVPGSFGEAGWEAKSGGFIPSGSGVTPHSISQFPADSAFIERAARFSCFGTGNIADMVHPFGATHPVNAYHQVATMPQNPHAVFGGNAARAASGGEPLRNEVNPPSASKDVPFSADHRGQEGSPEKLEKKNGGFDDDAKRAVSDKVLSPGGVGQEEPSLIDAGAEPSSAKGLGSKKRKRDGLDTEPEQSQQQSGEDFEDNGKKNSEALPSNKANGENGKQSSQTSDPPKEGYIHVRARRGQATNSHSLAERVRREKISERMKFLQDLVPGCSKVTGKAVMLDEIINYVQSLQRQVEFLSMKLATVNPRLDFNIESLLAKDQMLAARAGPPLGFSPDVSAVYPQLHPSQPTVIQPGLSVIGSSSDALRNINPQLISVSEGYKEHPPQMHLWDGELHNIVQMGFSSNTSSDNQDTNSSLPPGHTKVEL